MKKVSKNKMEPITLTLAIITALSEILPLLGCTKANGLLHGIKELFIHLHADSQCNIDVEVKNTTS